MDIKPEILKPCSVCNSKDSLMVYNKYVPTSKLNIGVVECTNKGCEMVIKAPTVEEAVEKWNRRPREDFLLEQNKALTEQLIIDERIENDLKAKLILAIEALEYYANSDSTENMAVKTIAKIKGE